MSDKPLAERLQAADKDTLHEIMRETEAYLSAQLTAAIGADQRAYTFAGMITAATVLLVGAAYALRTGELQHLWLSNLALLVATALFVSAWMAVISARSVDFEFPGNQACNWIDEIEEGKSLLHSLAEQCAHYDGMATTNTGTMTRNSSIFNWAVNIALGSVGLGGLAFVWWAFKVLPTTGG